MGSCLRHLRTGLTLAVALPVIAVPAMTRPSFAQTAPTCQPGYYYASDGYCYPQPQPTYAPPPPVYDPGPPAYQSSPDVAGVAVGVGLGLLVGALAAGAGDQHHNRAPAHEERGRRDHGHH